MPTVESVKNDIEALGTAGQEEILHYLEEVVCVRLICYRSYCNILTPFIAN